MCPTRTALLGTLAMVALATPAQATSVEPFTLAQTAHQADVIVHARVTRVDVGWGRHLGEPAIVTTLTLEQETAFKGKPLRTLTLFGGTVGEHSMSLVGQPRFTAGDEVFLFVETKEQACPFVGIWYGVYTVERRQIHRGARPVADVSRGDVVLGKDNDRGMTVAAFAAELRNILRRPAPQPTRITAEQTRITPQRPARVPPSERQPAKSTGARTPRRHAPREVYRREKGERQ